MEGAMTAPTAQIRPYTTVEEVAEELLLAFEWAGDDEERGTLDSIAAFVDLVRALDRYRRDIYGTRPLHELLADLEATTP
jgi:hypothetical protein